MQAPANPDNELIRLRMLRALQLLDTAPEERFDRFTRMAQRIFGVPTAVVSLVDEERQWFKSRQGLDATETPRDISFCGHAILQDETFVVEDASKDDRFSDNPLVTGNPHIRFYAGHPLRAPDGSKLGTVCLIDREAREVHSMDMQLLVDLTAMVEQEIKLITESTIDSLTHLSNRRGFDRIGAMSLALCERTETPATLLIFDLDGFKEVNDSLGHAVGDAILEDMGAALQEAFRNSDVVARLGGDEFAVLLTCAASAQAQTALGRLQEMVEARNQRPDSKGQLRYSVGVTEYDPKRHPHFSNLMNEADERMYEHKRSQGKAR